MRLLHPVARFAMASLFVLDAQMISQANSVSLVPVADTAITQKSPPPPNTRLDVGTNGKSQSSRALLEFDIAGNIPPDAIITSASLTVTVTSVPSAPVNSIFDLRAVLEDWSETDATWANRLVTTPWSTPGGAVGVDFSSQISQTNFFGSSTGPTTFVSSSNLVVDVQNWLQNPGANFGWVIISEAQGVNYTERGIASREDTADGPPTLFIQFAVPATPPLITVLPLTNAVFSFSFNAEAGRTYAVQYAGGLSGTNWHVLTNFTAVTTPTNFVVSDLLTASNRFYRVQTP